jgi:UDP-glucose 4-epimerase
LKLRVLVTGGAGFIGSHVVDRLVDEGCAVRVLDDLSSGQLSNVAGHLASGSVEFVKGSILERDDVARALDGVDGVVHLAAIVSVPFSVANHERTYEVNVYGTKVLLDKCAAEGVGRFVFASSSAVYGEAAYVPIDEVHPTNPLSPYAETKLVAEQMCIKDFGDVLSPVVLRLFNVYGRRQSADGYAGVITTFRERLLAEKALVVYGDGLQTRDFIHVSDVATTVWLALNSEARGVFNVCSGRAVSIRELAEVMAQLVDAEDVEVRFDGAREGDIRHSHGDYAKAREAFGFEPLMRLSDGICELVDATRPRLISAV